MKCGQPGCNSRATIRQQVNEGKDKVAFLCARHADYAVIESMVYYEGGSVNSFLEPHEQIVHPVSWGQSPIDSVVIYRETDAE